MSKTFTSPVSTGAAISPSRSWQTCAASSRAIRRPTATAFLQFNAASKSGTCSQDLPYPESMNVRFTDEAGKSQPMLMGSYGIGVTRLLGAAIEQNHDDKGHRVA